MHSLYSIFHGMLLTVGIRSLHSESNSWHGYTVYRVMYAPSPFFLSYKLPSLSPQLDVIGGGSPDGHDDDDDHHH